jgi:hypothetical protein
VGQGAIGVTWFYLQNNEQEPSQQFQKETDHIQHRYQKFCISDLHTNNTMSVEFALRSCMYSCHYLKILHWIMDSSHTDSQEERSADLCTSHVLIACFSVVFISGCQSLHRVSMAKTENDTYNCPVCTSGWNSPF